MQKGQHRRLNIDLESPLTSRTGKGSLQAIQRIIHLIQPRNYKNNEVQTLNFLLSHQRSSHDFNRREITRLTGFVEVIAINSLSHTMVIVCIQISSTNRLLQHPIFRIFQYNRFGMYVI